MIRRVKIAAVLGLLGAGCVKVEYLDYHGPQDWPTGAAFVRTVEGIEVYEGLPDRPYEVIGLVDVYDDDPLADAHARREVMELVDANDADALVWLSDRVLASGSLKMRKQSRVPAEVDSGRSTQPEVTIIRPGQYVQTAARRALRSTLLVVRWREPD